MGLQLSLFLEACQIKIPEVDMLRHVTRQEKTSEHLTFLQTQYVWWTGVLMGGDSCSTCQMDSGQLSALKTSTLQMPLLSVRNLVIPRESFQLIL